MTPEPAEHAQNLVANTISFPERNNLKETTPRAQVAPRHKLFTLISHLSYLWPSQNPSLQFVVLLCLLTIVSGCIVNAFAPFTLGALITTFTTPGVVPFPLYGSTPFPYLITYVVLCFLSSSAGLPALRHALWIPMMQYLDRTTSMRIFNKILALSLSWHTKRKTGELLCILDRMPAVNHVSELICFTILPIFLDVAVAVALFTMRFQPALGIVVGVVILGYIWASVVLATYRSETRRRTNDQDEIIRGIRTDSLLNYETVKYFGGEEHEAQKYAEAIGEYQSCEREFIFALNLHNLVQMAVITSGFLIGSIIVASRIRRGESDIGDFVVFIAYYAQLYFPLSQLGGVYRSIDQNLSDVEKQLSLLAEPTDVVDAPGAKDLVVENGEVEFENVSFSYEGTTPALENVSFKVPPGGHIVLVGNSGSGKSTVLRLLYRLCDLEPGNGRILIDGQDTRTVTLSSLRNAIGVVPHDPVLFNATVGYNIAYGRPSKTLPSQSTIVDAARAAEIHERIMKLPEGYETKVGERGVRLSDGEKQRVAIARTIVKNPKVVLLDQATSALDGAMEQTALVRLKNGRSCLIIPHQLNTIRANDVIVVLKEGRVVEQGSLKELSELHGIFASMLADQNNTSVEPLTYEAPVVDITEPEDKAIEKKIAVPQPVQKTISGRFPFASGSRYPSVPFTSDPAPLAGTSALDQPSVDIPGPPERSRKRASVGFDAGAISRPSSPEPSGRRVAHGIQRIARRFSISGARPKLNAHIRNASTVSSASGSGAASVSPPASVKVRESIDGAHHHAEKAKEPKRKKRKPLL